jgi:hypothetical protein
MGSIHEKNLGPKISCYCTFKEQIIFSALVSIGVRNPEFYADFNLKEYIRKGAPK